MLVGIQFISQNPYVILASYLQLVNSLALALDLAALNRTCISATDSEIQDSKASFRACSMLIDQSLNAQHSKHSALGKQ